MIESQTVTQLLKAVDSWEGEFDELALRIGQHAQRVDTRRRLVSYIESLLREVDRRNSWQLAESAGDDSPYAFQHILGRANWSVEGVCDEVRTYACEHLHSPQGVLVVDETGFLKQGRHSAGVQRQYSGTAGRIENCQIGVFLAYASSQGHCLIDRELYLPKAWLEAPERCRQAGIPEETIFQTKPQLAEAMLRRAFEAGIDARWVLGDAVYGDNRCLRLFLEEQGQAYVLAVSGKEYVWRGLRQISVKELIAHHQPPAEHWHRLSAGEGTKGERLYDWTCLVTAPPLDEHWARGLLLRRSLEDPEDITAYVVFAPSGTPLEELVVAAGQRWTIETCFLEAKDCLGLDQYEVRSWTGWYRHITLVMAAQAFLAALRSLAQKKIRRKAGCTWI